MEKSDYVVRVENLSKIYDRTKVLDNISLDLKYGEILGIIGPNGAGKTTLLESIEGLREIQHGQVTVFGEDVKTNQKKIQSRIGIQLQKTSLFSNLNLSETLRMFATLYGIKLDIKEMLNTFGLNENANKLVAHLSGGQFQRFNLCLAMLNEPKLLFLDEPTTGLDPLSRRKLWDIVKGLSKKKVSIILSTHYMEEAEGVCDRILILDRGHIVDMDTPENLIKKLGVEKTITVELDKPITDELIANLNHGSQLRLVDNKLFIYTHDVPPTLSSLFAFASKNDIRIENINIRTANLEDVFIVQTTSLDQHQDL